MFKATLTKLFVFGLITLLFVGCSKEEDDERGLYKYEECELIADLGQILLKPNSKSFIPYPDSVSKLIFRDADGQEFIGVVRDYNTNGMQTFSSLGMYPCPIDSSFLIEYNFNPEYKFLQIEFEDLDIWLNMNVLTTLSSTAYDRKLVADIFSIQLIRTSDEAASVYQQPMKIIVNEGTHPNPYENYSSFQPEYERHGTNFQNVYINQISTNGDFEILYNDQFGVLAIRNFEDPIIDLVFDRIEFD